MEETAHRELGDKELAVIAYEMGGQCWYLWEELHQRLYKLKGIDGSYKQVLEEAIGSLVTAADRFNDFGNELMKGNE